MLSSDGVIFIKRRSDDFWPSESKAWKRVTAAAGSLSFVIMMPYGVTARLCVLAYACSNVGGLALNSSFSHSDKLVASFPQPPTFRIFLTLLLPPLPLMSDLCWTEECEVCSKWMGKWGKSAWKSLMNEGFPPLFFFLHRYHPTEGFQSSLEKFYYIAVNKRGLREGRGTKNIQEAHKRTHSGVLPRQTLIQMDYF